MTTMESLVEISRRLDEVEKKVFDDRGNEREEKIDDNGDKKGNDGAEVKRRKNGESSSGNESFEKQMQGQRSVVNLTSRLDRLEKIVESKRKKLPLFDSLLAKKEMDSLLTETSALVLEDSTVKETIILNYSDQLQEVGAQYDRLKELTPYVESERIAESQKEWTKRLDDLAKRQIDINRRVNELRERAGKITRFHHKMTENVSLKFIETDKVLRSVEKLRATTNDGAP